MRKINNYINGSVSSISSNYLQVDDPSTGEKIAEVIMSNADDLNLALESSKNAFAEWSNFTPLKRSRVLSKYKEILEKNIELLAKIVSQEHGMN